MSQALYKKGSEWRKWDLHVHTPSSFYNNYNSVSGDIWDTFIKDLESLPPEFKVLGINDYIFIDGYRRLLKEKEENGRLGNIDMLLPVIELRLNKFCGTDSKLSKVNFHIIFSPEIKPDVIQQHFLNAIPRHYQLSVESSITKDWQALATEESLKDLGKKIKNSVPVSRLKDYGSDLQEGFNNINFDENKIIEVLNTSQYFKEKYFTAIGKTEWADIKWDDKSIANKKDVINKVNFVFISSDTPELYEKSKKQLTDSKVNDLLLDCSDAHNFSTASVKDRIGNCFTWIKADPTFSGLAQVINEPTERVFVGVIPPKLETVNDDKAKHIASIKISHTLPDTTPSWFDDELLLNSGLVAIIGKKGNGKSALADIIGLCGDSSIKPEDYSFLTTEKFKKRNLAKNYEATLTWTDNQSIKKNLNDIVGTTALERVKYLPQQYVENICNDDGVSGLFQKEIDKVIFSYVPNENRLGAQSLSELINLKTESINESLNTKREELHKLDEQIEGSEEKRMPQYLDAIKKKLEEKKRELKNLDEPKKVKEPAKTLDKGTEEKIKNFTDDIAKIEVEITASRDSLLETNNKLQKLKKIEDGIISLENKLTSFINENEDNAKELSIDLSKIVSLKVFKDVLEIKESELFRNKKALEVRLEQDNLKSKDSLYNKKSLLEAERKKITATLDADQKLYKDYLQAVKEYKLKQQVINGKKGDTSLETITSIESEIDYVTTKLDGELLKLYKRRADITISLFKTLQQKIDFYKDIYTPLVKFIKSEKDTQKKSGNTLGFTADVLFSKQKFNDDFFTYINQQRDGSFQKTVEGQKMLNAIVEKYDFTKVDDVTNFLEDVLDHLRNDKTSNTDKEKYVKEQLKKTPAEFYNFLFGLEYLDVKYKILFNEKDLNANEFSPGEKGALLLIFYLLIDKENIPLIIDQPEENLDNESVYTLLVPYIKRAKHRRQIIAITHNPNLAVVCDAEQIIYASMDKIKSKIRYSSGSIENPIINKRIVDVLEGTLPAFTIRDKKYIREMGI